ESQQKVFDWLKQCLTQSFILQYPDYFELFILFTDAFYQELGTVLSQIKNSQEHVIVYASRTLTLAEQNYSTIELECLAVIWAIKYFRYYIYGKRFTLITDHKAL
ncbi:14650_t:CDS:1, partial [Gigaspora margarita]